MPLPGACLKPLMLTQVNFVGRYLWVNCPGPKNCRNRTRGEPFHWEGHSSPQGTSCSSARRLTLNYARSTCEREKKFGTDSFRPARARLQRLILGLTESS